MNWIHVFCLLMVTKQPCINLGTPCTSHCDVPTRISLSRTVVSPKYDAALRRQTSARCFARRSDQSASTACFQNNGLVRLIHHAARVVAVQTARRALQALFNTVSIRWLLGMRVGPAEPARTLEESPRAAEGPRRTAEQPRRAAEEPRKVTEEPKRADERPDEPFGPPRSPADPS